MASRIEPENRTRLDAVIRNRLSYEDNQQTAFLNEITAAFQTPMSWITEAARDALDAGLAQPDGSNYVAKFDLETRKEEIVFALDGADIRLRRYQLIASNANGNHQPSTDWHFQGSSVTKLFVKGTTYPNLLFGHDTASIDRFLTAAYFEQSNITAFENWKDGKKVRQEPGVLLTTSLWFGDQPRLEIKTATQPEGVLRFTYTKRGNELMRKEERGLMFSSEPQNVMLPKVVAIPKNNYFNILQIPVDLVPQPEEINVS